MGTIYELCYWARTPYYLSNSILFIHGTEPDGQIGIPSLPGVRCKLNPLLHCFRAQFLIYGRLLLLRG